MKYIDAEKLIAEITRIYNEHPVHSTEQYEDGMDDGYHGCCDEIVALIESLQQEQKDIIVLNKKDWEKQEQFRKDKKFGIPLKQEQPEVDLEEEVKEWMKYGPHTCYPWCSVPDAIEITARHFYELGLNTRGK